MHDIDAQIAKISGQANYMDSLQKITGNIMTVDKDMYHEKHTKISACDFNIKILLRRISDECQNKTISDIKTLYDTESTKLNIKDNTFIMYQRKTKKNVKPPREIVAPGYSPSELIKTEWFKHVKHIEKEINKFMISSFPEGYEEKDKCYEYLEDEYKKHPELVDLRTIYDCKIC